METKENYSVKLPPSVKELVKLAAHQADVRPAEWIRQAISEKLQRGKKGVKNGVS